MKSEILRIRREFLERASEMINESLALLDGRKREGIKRMRLTCRWVATLGPLHGYRRLGLLADEVEKIVLTDVLRKDIIRERAYYKTLLEKLLKECAVATLDREIGRILLFTKRQDLLEQLEGEDVEWVSDAKEAVVKAKSGDLMAIIVDLSSPIEEVVAVVRAAMGRSSIVRSPVIAIYERSGVVNRFRVEQEGVRALIKMPCSQADIGRAISRGMRETTVSLGTIYVVCQDDAVARQLETDLQDEGYFVHTSRELEDLYRQWVIRPPDGVVVLASKTMLRAIRELRDDPEARCTPFVTLIRDLEAEQTGHMLEATDWLLVPWTREELILRVCRRVDIKALLKRREIAGMPRPDSVTEEVTKSPVAEPTAIAEPAITPAPVVEAIEPPPPVSSTQAPLPLEVSLSEGVTEYAAESPVAEPTAITQPAITPAPVVEAIEPPPPVSSTQAPLPLEVSLSEGVTEYAAETPVAEPTAIAEPARTPTPVVEAIEPPPPVSSTQAPLPSEGSSLEAAMEPLIAPSAGGSKLEPQAQLPESSEEAGGESSPAPMYAGERLQTEEMTALPISVEESSLSPEKASEINQFARKAVSVPEGLMSETPGEFRPDAPPYTPKEARGKPASKDAESDLRGWAAVEKLLSWDDGQEDVLEPKK